MKAIMVPVADRPECAKALKAAFRFAEEHEGNVMGYHVRPHQKEQRQSGGDKRTYAWQEGKSNRQIDLDSKNAERLFATLAEEHQFTIAKKPRYSKSGGLAQWHAVTGDPDHIFSIIGPLSDLIVVSRPRSKRSVKAHAFAHAALTRSARPVLHLPQKNLKTLGQHVLVAWNQSEQASAALMASMPVLRQASRVTLVTSPEKRHLGPSIKHVQHYLKFNGVQSTVERTPAVSAKDEIVQAYSDSGADLLVMGAYSRPKWREHLFGGVTTHILEHTQIPVLMLHSHG